MANSDDLQRDLAQHASGLRRMARALLRDSHAADDAVQDTMHRALAHEPEPGPMGGWLRRTMVNVTRQRRRSDRRRIERENHAKAPEPEPSPPEASSRREVLRTVTDAVLALDEPYQTAIFMRYFEDLPPRTIAKRTGANLATIKSRLQRGLAMLRARLDGRAGGDRRQWRLALLATFGLPAGPTTTGITLTVGTLIMGTATKTLIAAGVLGAVGLFLYGFGQDPAPLPTAATTAAVAPSAATAESELSKLDAGTVREEVLPKENAPAWLDHPFTLELDLLVVDALGLPVADKKLSLGPPNCSLNEPAVSTGKDGRAKISWRSRQPSGEIVFGDRQKTLRRVQLQHGRPTQVTLIRERPTPFKAYRLENGSQMLISSFSITMEPGYTFASNSTGTPTMRPGMHPHAEFGTWPGAAAKPGWGFRMPAMRTAQGSTGGSMRIAYAPPSTDPPSEHDLTPTRIAGTVFGEDGKPAAKVHVALMKQDLPVSHTKTDNEGQFAFEELSQSEFVVRAGGDSQGLATCPAKTTQGTTPVTLHLARGAIVRGKAQTSNGQPLRKAPVTWRAADGSWSDATKTAADGTFMFANLPSKPGHVLLWDPKGTRHLPIAFAKDVVCNSTDLLLEDSGSSSALRITPVQPEELSGYATIWVWSEDTGIATTVPMPDEGEEWVLPGLNAGWYHVELFHPAIGTKNAGRHWIDGKGDCHLGRAILGKPAKVHVVGEGLPEKSERNVELYRIDVDLDRRVEIRDSIAGEDPLAELLLEAGAYALFWVDKGGKVRFQRFVAEAGTEVTVRIPD